MVVKSDRLEIPEYWDYVSDELLIYDLSNPYLRLDYKSVWGNITASGLQNLILLSISYI